MFTGNRNRFAIKKVLLTKVFPFAAASVTMLSAVCASVGPLQSTAQAVSPAWTDFIDADAAVKQLVAWNDPDIFETEDGLSQYAPKAECEQIGTIQQKDDWSAVQGGCTDGKYAYVLVENSEIAKTDASRRRQCILRKIDLQTWEVVAESKALPLDHGNDITYNSKLNQLVVTHCYDSPTHLSFINPDTLEIESTKEYYHSVYGIAYDAAHDRYVMGIRGSYEFAIFDGDFNLLQYFHGVDTHYTKQGIECDEDYIYFVTSSENAIVCYDWDGNFKGVYDIEGTDEEVEHLFTDGKSWYLSTNLGSGGKSYEVTFDRTLLDSGVYQPGGSEAEESYFVDVPVTHWAYEDIMKAKEAGVIQGVLAGESGKYAYLPNNSVTGSELTAILVRGYMNDKVKAPQAGEAWDVPYIQAAKENGLLDGLDGLALRQPISRYDMAVLLANTVKAVALDPQASFSGKTIDDFSDADSIPEKYRDAVAYCVSIGILNGSDGKFNGERSVTRAETAAIYNRLARFTVLQPALPVPMITETVDGRTGA